MERVKRLAGNEIELGIGYRRSNLGQVTYRLTKGIAYGLIESSTPWFTPFETEYPHPIPTNTFVENDILKT